MDRTTLRQKLIHYKAQQDALLPTQKKRSLKLFFQDGQHLLLNWGKGYEEYSTLSKTGLPKTFLVGFPSRGLKIELSPYRQGEIGSIHYPHVQLGTLVSITNYHQGLDIQAIAEEMVRKQLQVVTQEIAA